MCFHGTGVMTAGIENRIKRNKYEFVPNLRDIKSECRKLNFILLLFNESEEQSGGRGQILLFMHFPTF